MIEAILLDIEGTTTPIDFVHKTLFPYAAANIGDFLRENWGIIQNEVSQLKTEHENDSSYATGFDASSPVSVIDYVLFLIKADRKSTPLKSLQGMIWQKGYESGELKSEIFGDVPVAFEKWRVAGKTIAIYSSGSVLAQKLLFRFTENGDLTPFISAYFDTNTGGKRETESYTKIADGLKLLPGQILFSSDIAEELDAARESGMETLLSVRNGNQPVVENFGHTAVTSFLDEHFPSFH